MNLAPFRLYGLIGCPHCENAEKYLRENLVPFEIIVANADPIIQDGVEKRTGQGEYPVLLNRINNQIILGFKREEYTGAVEAYRTLIRASGSSVFGGGQQNRSEIPAVSTTDSKGAN